MTVSLLQAFARMKSSACQEEQGLVGTGKSQISLHPCALEQPWTHWGVTGATRVQELPHVWLGGSCGTPGWG